MGAITAKLGPHFQSEVRRRGQSYVDLGLVEIEHLSTDGWIDALAIGRGDYEVQIKIDRTSPSWEIAACCTCPGEVGACCRHIWATLLKAERDPRMRSLGPVPADLVFKILDPTALAGRRSASGSAEQGAPRRPALQRGLVPAWLQVLRQLPGGDTLGAAPPAGGQSPLEPVYVLEGQEIGRAHEMVLGLHQRRPAGRGKAANIKPLKLMPADILRMPLPDDRQVCLMLIGAGVPSYGYGCFVESRLQARPTSLWKIPPALQTELLPRLLGSGRLYFRASHAGPLIPVRGDDDGPWELVLTFAPCASGERHKMFGQLRRGQQRQALEDVDCFISGAPDMMVCQGVLSQVTTHDCLAWVGILKEQRALVVDPSELGQLLQQLHSLGVFPPVEWPASWGITEIEDLEPRGQLSLSRWGQTWYEAQVSFLYGELSVDAAKPGRYLVDAARRRVVARQRDLEQALSARLYALGFKHDKGRDRPRAPVRGLQTLIYTLLSEGWTVLGERQVCRRPGSLSVHVRSGIDWFDVHGDVDFEGLSVALPELLAAVRQGQRFVKLGDGSVGLLPEQWLTQHQAWMSLGELQDDGLRFGSAQLGLIDALLALLPQATFDDRLAEAREKLRRFSGIQPCPEPAGFVGRLRHYQKEGLGWLKFLQQFGWGGCLADDMGLGKTVQVLALLADVQEHHNQGPSLMVAPKSVVFNWLREAERFAPQLAVLNYTGKGRKNLQEQFDRHDLIVTTYGTLRRDAAFLSRQTFNYAVLDEAQAIKNPRTLSAKAARLLQARRRLVLTGTPVENHLGDLWSLFEFLNPGMLGSLQAFKLITTPPEEADHADQQLKLLRRGIKPFILRRTKQQVAPELPPRSEQTIMCTLGAQQMKYYRQIRDYYRASVLSRVDDLGLANSKMHVLEALLRLRQAACHPALIAASEKHQESAKLETLMAMVSALVEEGHKALIFSQFTALLAVVRAELERSMIEYAYLDGGTRNREQVVDRFQGDPRCPLFLISLKAGGLGLNLTAADYVLILDPWWNPAAEAQAIDRSHRIGQQNKVMAYRLIAADTVEEKIIELQQSKQRLADAIITQHNSVIGDLSREDLALLLS